MGESVIVPQKIKNRITARCSRPTCGSPPQRPPATLRVLHALKGRHKRSSWSHIGCVYESAEDNLRPRALAAARAQQRASGPRRCPRAVRGEVFTGRCPQGARYKPKSDPEIGRSSQRGHLERTPQPFQDPGVLGVGGEGSG